MQKINYLSDFDFILDIYDAKGEEVGIPDYDFTAVIYTTAKSNGWTISQKRGKLSGCYNDGGKLHVVCDNHSMQPGKLKIDFTAELPNGIYPDYRQRQFWSAPIDDIELVADQGDAPNETVAEVIPPYAYTSAYKLAKAAGYTGTEGEYTEALNKMPEVVNECNNAVNDAKTAVEEGEDAVKKAQSALDAINKVSEGKKLIIAELKAKGVNVSDDASFEELAQKINELNVTE